MPRTGRGGKRQGTPGTAYPNRTDLNKAPRATQPIRTATGQPYGQAGAQEAAQRAIPLPNQGMAVPRPPSPAPGQLPPLTAPTTRPTEPLTHGLPTGPGAGPEILGGMSNAADDDVEGTLRAIATQFPNSDVHRLLAQLAQRQRK